MSERQCPPHAGARIETSGNVVQRRIHTTGAADKRRPPHLGALNARTCEICGAKQPEDGRWRLQAHHIDHTRATYAKHLIVIVCPRCHIRCHHYMATDWRWLFDPPPAIRARVISWWAARCGLNLTPAECEERAEQLSAIMRTRLADVFRPIDWPPRRSD